MSLLTEKIILLVVLFVLGFCTGTAPYILRNRCLSPSRCRDLIVSLLNCFSAGVFFATFFMHMMPEAQEVFGETFPQASYPFAELLISLGFFFVMFIEQFVMAWYARKDRQRTDCPQTIENSHAIPSNSGTETRTHRLRSSTSENNNDGYKTLPPNSPERNSTTVFSDVIRVSASSSATEIHCCQNGNTVNCNNNHSPTELPHPHPTETGRTHEGHTHEGTSAHSIRSLVLLFALSTHALFEGLTIGFQTTETALSSLVAAVIVHKTALAFSYGMSLINNNTKLSIVLLSMLIFAVMAPAGIGIGTGLSSAKDADSTVKMVVAILQAFSAGTFLYVIFIEIIPHEFVSKKLEHRIPKVLSLATGFATMAALQVLHKED